MSTPEPGPDDEVQPVQVYSEYNADLLTPEQIAELDGALRADLAEMAADDPEDEADGAEAEAGTLTRDRRGRPLMSAEPNNWRGRARLASYTPEPEPDGDGGRVAEIVRLGEPKAPGTALVPTAGWLLLLLAAGVLAVSFAGQFAYIWTRPATRRGPRTSRRGCSTSA